MTKTYSELCKFNTFMGRFEYLRMQGSVGQATFGFDRHLNQHFYRSFEWRSIRQQVIFRDNGCDLGISGYEITDQLLVHHINPMGAEDILAHEDWILDPEYLITTTQITHNAIHYGDSSLLSTPFVERTPGDTKLW